MTNPAEQKMLEARPGHWWERLTSRTCRAVYRSDWPAFAGADFADRIMQAHVTDRFHAKQGRSTGRWLLQASGHTLSVYLKRHYRLPWGQRLLALLGSRRASSPAFGEWHNLLWAEKHGIPVPAPVAVGEFIGPWWRLQSFLAVEELLGMIPLHEAVPLAQEQLPPCVFAQWKKGIVHEVARLSRLLHRAHYYHKDFYLCHFFVQPPGKEQATSTEEWKNGRGTGSDAHPSILPFFHPSIRPPLYLIDLHRLGHHPWISRRWQVKDLAQLLYSSDVPGVDARDRLRFFRLYRGRRQWTWAERRLLRAILRKERHYREHNHRSGVRGQESGVSGQESEVRSQRSLLTPDP